MVWNWSRSWRLRRMPTRTAPRICEQQLRRNMQRFRGGLVFQAHTSRLLCHSTQGSRAIKTKEGSEDLRSVRCPIEQWRIPGARHCQSSESLGTWSLPVFDRTSHAPKILRAVIDYRASKRHQFQKFKGCLRLCLSLTFGCQVMTACASFYMTFLEPFSKFQITNLNRLNRAKSNWTSWNQANWLQKPIQLDVSTKPIRQQTPNPL